MDLLTQIFFLLFLGLGAGLPTYFLRIFVYVHEYGHYTAIEYFRKKLKYKNIHTTVFIGIDHVANAQRVRIQRIRRILNVNFNIVCDAKPKKGYTKSNFYNALAKDTGKYRNCIIRINALSGKIAEALVCIIGALLLFLLLLLVKSTLWLALEYLPCIISSVGFLLSSSFFTFIQFKAGSDHSDCSFFKNPEKFINTYDSEQLHLQEVQSP